MTNDAPMMRIDGRPIGGGNAPFVIAELSANHLGSLARARQIVTAAAAAGADAIKLQTYTADTITLDCDRPEFTLTKGEWAGRTMHGLYQEAYTPWEWHGELFALARELGLVPFSSPFDPTAVEFLASLDCPVYKIASFEIVDHRLIELCARTGKPIIMSTGMASADEVDEAVAVARRFGCTDLAVLHCISGYPTPPEQCNLRRMLALRERTNAVVGISDHSLGNVVPTAAVALGASLIEKHLTLARADGGPDGAFSLEPREFGDMVGAAKTTWAALGSGRFERAEAEKLHVTARRSLYIVEDVAAGDTFTHENVRSIRPAHGLAPKYLDDILGSVAATDITTGTPLTWEHVDSHSPVKVEASLPAATQPGAQPS